MAGITPLPYLEGITFLMREAQIIHGLYYCMSTTVELKKNTVKVLEELKKRYGTKSIDETVKRIIF
jgi:hypothetical protein